MLPDDRIDSQMPVPLQRRDETRQDGFQTLPANAIGSFPEYDERLADRLGIDPPGQGGWLVDHRINSGEQSNSMLAMTASDGNEFIKDCCFLELGCLLITLAKNFEQFVFRLLADLRAHAAPPEVGNIPVRQQLILGNNIDESTRLLEINPRLQAKTLFGDLPRRFPGGDVGHIELMVHTMDFRYSVRTCCRIWTVSGL